MNCFLFTISILFDCCILIPFGISGSRRAYQTCHSHNVRDWMLLKTQIYVTKYVTRMWVYIYSFRSQKLKEQNSLLNSNNGIDNNRSNLTWLVDQNTERLETSNILRSTWRSSKLYLYQLTVGRKVRRKNLPGSRGNRLGETTCKRLESLESWGIWQTVIEVK